MKKIFNYLIGFGVALLIIIVLLIILIPNRNDLTILSVEKEYLLASNTKEIVLNMVTFADEKDSVYFNKDIIKDAYILDSETNEKFKVSLVDAVNTKKKVDYVDRSYYQYNLSFNVDFYSSTPIKILNAYLLLSYPDDSTITVRIGSIIRYFEDHNGPLEYTRLKGIVNEYNDLSYLCGVIIDVYSEDIIYIKDIIPLSHGLNIDGENVLSGEIDYKYNTNMKDIIIGYNPLKNKTPIEPFYLKGKNSILLPLEYDSLKQLMVTGFIIKYEANGVMYEKLINPFKYFDIKQNYDYKINKVTYDKSKNI